MEIKSAYLPLRLELKFKINIDGSQNRLLQKKLQTSK